MPDAFPQIFPSHCGVRESKFSDFLLKLERRTERNKINNPSSINKTH